MIEQFLETEFKHLSVNVSEIDEFNLSSLPAPIPLARKSSFTLHPKLLNKRKRYVEIDEEDERRTQKSKKLKEYREIE